MIMLPQHLFARLLENGAAPDGTDHVPVVKYFDPAGAATWLITEAVPHAPDVLFGLCDLGMGCPEVGYVRFSELQAVKNRLGLPLERDLYFHGLHPISVYAHAAHLLGRITEDAERLAHAARTLKNQSEPHSDLPDTGE